MKPLTIFIFTSIGLLKVPFIQGTKGEQGEDLSVLKFLS